MRLRIDFGLSGPRKELNWYQDITGFPKVFAFNGKKWNWLSYEKDPNLVYDLILTYSEIPSYDPDYHATMGDFDDMFGYRTRTGCECGSIYTSYKDGHMFYCPMWRKV